MIMNIPGPLREFTGGADRVVVNARGPTLADALAALWARYPGLRDRVTTEQGEIREHINIFVGTELVRYTGGLMTRVSTESEISIVPAISGGSAETNPRALRASGNRVHVRGEAAADRL